LYAGIHPVNGARPATPTRAWPRPAGPGRLVRRPGPGAP